MIPVKCPINGFYCDTEGWPSSRKLQVHIWELTRPCTARKMCQSATMYIPAAFDPFLYQRTRMARNGIVWISSEFPHLYLFVTLHFSLLKYSPKKHTVYTYICNIRAAFLTSTYIESEVVFSRTQNKQSK
jgi:hypothetical protein